MIRKKYNLKINLNNLFEDVRYKKKYVQKLKDKIFILEKIAEKKENFSETTPSDMPSNAQLQNNLNVFGSFTTKLLSVMEQMKQIKFLIYPFNSNKIINIKNKENFLIDYIIEIKFTRTDTFLTVKNSLSKVWCFRSAGSLQFSKKEKVRRFLVLKKFYEILVLELEFLKNTQIALHLINLGFLKKTVVKKLKKFFFIQTLQYYEEYPYNGCRKKKIKRKKIKKKNKKNKKAGK